MRSDDAGIRRLFGGLIGFTFLSGLIWRVTPLYHRFDFNRLGDWLQRLQGHWWAPFVIMGAFMAAGLVLFLHAVMLWATVFAFDPWHSMFYCEIGSIASGLMVYGIGRILRPDVVRRIAGTYLGRVSRALGRSGTLTIVVLHWFPVCPFNVLNLLAGSTHIRFRDFLIGTLIGVTPGIIFISFFGDRLRQVILHPEWHTILGAVGFLVLGLLVLRFARRYVANLPDRSK